MAEFKKILTADLCPKKPDPKLFDAFESKISVTVTITAKKDIPSSKSKRAVEVAQAKIDEYSAIIQKEVTVLEGKVKAAQKEGDAAKMNSLVEGTSGSVKNACNSMQGAVEIAVKAMLKKEAQGDQNLLEAKVVVGVKITFGVISIAASATRLGVTAGADVHAWYTLVKGVKKVAELIHSQCKKEKTLRGELLMAIGKYCTDKQRRVIEEEKAATSKKAKFVFQAKEIYRGVKPKAEQAEAARKAYRNEVTSLRQKVDKYFTQVDALAAEFKKAPNLKQGVALGKGVMDMKRTGRAMEENLTKCNTFAEAMAGLMTEAGMKVDDRNIIEKLTSLSTLKGSVEFADGLNSAVNDVMDMVGDIAQMVA